MPVPLRKLGVACAPRWVACAGENAYSYVVESLKDFNNVIIPHFTKYPLISQKRSDFELLKQVIDFINQKNHTTLIGLQHIVNIKASMNLKEISKLLKDNFADINPVPRPIVEYSGIQDPHGLAGFASAEGCFMIKSTKSLTHKTGISFRLNFTINQHSRDAELIKGLIDYLGCGSYYPSSKLNQVEFRVYKFTEIDKIFLFFDKYNIQGTKVLDYKYFARGYKLMTNGSHLEE